MIRISKEKAKSIEKEYKDWYEKTIDRKLIMQLLKKLKGKEINGIKSDVVNKYHKFLKSLNDEEDLSILSNEKMIKYIEKYNAIDLSLEEIKEKVKNIRKKESSDYDKLIRQENKKSIKYRLEKKIKMVKEKEIFIINIIESEYTQELTKIFNYNKLNDAKRHKIMTKLDIRVCPYCQRNYITSYNKDKTKKTTSDLDHFYSKSEYPFLALSLYNFIPSCQICNKGKSNKAVYTKEGKVIYPYDGQEFTGIFRTNDKIILSLLENNTEKEFKIIFEKLDKNSEVTKDMFKLDKIYEYSHNKYIIDMLKYIQERPNSFLNSISEIFIEEYKNDEKIKDIVKNELLELLLEPYKFKIENGEPLGKLTKDILEEFEIL